MAEEMFPVCKLQDRRLTADMCEVYRTLHRPYQNQFDLVDNRAGNIAVTRSRTTLKKSSFNCRVKKYWNALPSTVKDSKNSSDFKCKLLKIIKH